MKIKLHHLALPFLVVVATPHPARAEPGDTIIHVQSKPIQVSEDVRRTQILAALEDPSLVLRHFRPPSDGVSPKVTRLSNTTARLEMPIKVELWPLGERTYGIAADMTVRKYFTVGNSEFSCSEDEFSRQIDLNTHQACLDLGKTDSRAITIEDANAAAYTYAIACSQFSRRIKSLAIQVCIGPHSSSGVTVRSRTLGLEGVLAVDPEDRAKETFVLNNLNSAVKGRIDKIQGNIIAAVEAAARTIPIPVSDAAISGSGGGTVFPAGPAH
ncbi:MAG: hypothetical protein AAB425_10580 [Bdellovibrionota bacterium]